MVFKWFLKSVSVSTLPHIVQYSSLYRAGISQFLAHHNQLLNSTPLEHTSSATPNPLCELKVLGHDGDPLGVNGAEHGVLEQGGEVRFRSLLKSQDGNCLEPRAKPLVSLVLFSELYCLFDLRSCMLLLATRSATSLTSLENGSFGMRRLVDFWYFLISLMAAIPLLLGLLFWTGVGICFSPLLTGAGCFLRLVFSVSSFPLWSSRSVARNPEESDEEDESSSSLCFPARLLAMLPDRFIKCYNSGRQNKIFSEENRFTLSNLQLYS